MGATVPELFEGYSQALYATWLWYRPFRLLFDAGEGVALHLQNSVFGVRHLFLSHGHLDHLSGLPSLFNIRNNGMGDNSQPLTIAYPRDDLLVAWMRAYLDQSVNFGDLEVEWVPVLPGSRVEIDGSRLVEAFPTEHAKGFTTLGYRVLDRRRRRRPSLAGLSESELRDLAQREGRDAVSEPYEHPLLVYGGDGLVPPREVLAGADVACLDVTFLTPEDRGRPTHGALTEVMAACTEARVATLIVAHVSGRYRLRDVQKAIRDEAARCGFGGQVMLLWRERLMAVVDDGDRAP